MPWFMQSLDRGYFEVINPYNRLTSRVSADPENIHSIVFWSKNFGPFLRQGYDRVLTDRGFRLFFNFSINSPDSRLEPNLPDLSKRLDQLTCLAQRFGGDCIQWRFDPVCFYRESGGPLKHNLNRFGQIARSVAMAGVGVCISSFVDLYRKVLRRTSRCPGLEFADPPIEEKISRIEAMQRILAPLAIALHLCCENELLKAAPAGLSLRQATCIPGRRLVERYGPGISLSKDPGQRASAGCGCTLSKDIGSYALHPCRHDCLYCYANPVSS
jgi:hypothetical protein